MRNWCWVQGRGDSDFLSPRPTRAAGPLPRRCWTPGAAASSRGSRWIMSRIESLTRARIDRSKEQATKTREKEKMKEAKDARYTNGHLFTTISVSGMTMCYACNKSITAKEALICPTCNVTIHNRCKDTLANVRIGPCGSRPGPPLSCACLCCFQAALSHL